MIKTPLTSRTTVKIILMDVSMESSLKIQTSLGKTSKMKMVSLVHMRLVTFFYSLVFMPKLI
nr:MAG TPA: hypothetical protein [Caudoviricetes sp.]